MTRQLLFAPGLKQAFPREKGGSYALRA